MGDRCAQRGPVTLSSRELVRQCVRAIAEADRVQQAADSGSANAGGLPAELEIKPNAITMLTPEAYGER